MPLTKQVAELIDKLIALSGDDKVDWQETADENTFLATVTKFVVRVSKGDDERYPTYTFKVADESSKTLEDVSAAGAQPYRENLEQLYELARRRALHVDEALSNLLSSLEAIR